MNNTLIASILLTAVVVGGGGFYGGMKYAQAHPAQIPGGRAANAQGFRNGFSGGQGQGRGAGGMGNAGFTAGSIVSKDTSTLTLKLRDGGSKLVLYSTSTRVAKTSEGTLNDLVLGTEVTVMGSANQDGSVTAGQVQIRPAGQPDLFMGGPRGGRGGQSVQ